MKRQAQRKLEAKRRKAQKAHHKHRVKHHHTVIVPQEIPSRALASHSVPIEMSRGFYDPSIGFALLVYHLGNMIKSQRLVQDLPALEHQKAAT